MGIGTRLSSLMDSNNTNANELAKKIGVSPQTIYSIIKRDSKKADIEVLLKIADIFGVTAEYFVNENISTISASELYSKKDFEHLKAYCSLDSLGRSHVDTVLKWETDRMKRIEQKPKENNYTHTPDVIPMRFLSYYQRMASAGSGEFLFPDIPTEVIPVPDTPLSRRADFVIGVNGRSMEDTYFDGDKVLVEKTPDVPIGAIGIFIRGSECFIKEMGEDRLISHNRDKVQYPDIIPDERRIDAIGIVLGKVGD